MRNLLLGVVALTVVGCPKPETQEEGQKPPKGETAPKKEAPEKEPLRADADQTEVKLKAPTPGAVCTYELKEVMTETLGDQIVAGHEVTITYQLEAVKSEAPIAFDAKVTRIVADAKRESYSAKLDSRRGGDMVRIRGGADTLVMYEMVTPFAMLDRTVRLNLDRRGHLRSVEGGDAVRTAFLEIHPPKPRKSSHYQGRAALALSDEAIADYLYPAATIVPKEGPLISGRQEKNEGVTFDLVEYVGAGIEAFRVVARPDRWLMEHKAGFGPSDAQSAVPKLPNAAAETALLQGDTSVTVEFEPTNPCFRQAGSAFNDRATWHGMIKEVEANTERKRTITRIWKKT